jgi:hypothetical protein
MLIKFKAPSFWKILQGKPIRFIKKMLNSYVASLIGAVSSGAAGRVSTVSGTGRVSLASAVGGAAWGVSLAASVVTGVAAAAVAAGREAGLGTAGVAVSVGGGRESAAATAAAEAAGAAPAVAVAATVAAAAAARRQVTAVGRGGLGAHRRQKGKNNENLQKGKATIGLRCVLCTGHVNVWCKKKYFFCCANNIADFIDKCWKQLWWRNRENIITSLQKVGIITLYFVWTHILDCILFIEPFSINFVFEKVKEMDLCTKLVKFLPKCAAFYF